MAFISLAEGGSSLDSLFLKDYQIIDRYMGLYLYQWGSNNYGRYGNNTIITSSVPVLIGALTNWSTIDTTLVDSHMLAIKTDGSLWACGENTSGQLGQSDVTRRSSPVRIGSLTNWKSVSAGASASYALNVDNKLFAWGGNSTGELGDGTTIPKSSPIQIGALTTWKSVVASVNYVCGIRTDGTLWSWGYNIYGQLGLGNTVSRSSPVQIGTLNTWTSVACGYAHVVATKSDGTLWSWGYNISGQLGQGHRSNRSSPVQIGTLTDWKQASCGMFHTAAVKTDGTLWTWGDNYGAGELGDGTNISRSSPVQIGSLTTWKQVAAGDYATNAIKIDGTLWGWGNSTTSGLVNTYSSPVQLTVSGVTFWKSVTQCGAGIALY